MLFHRTTSRSFFTSSVLTVSAASLLLVGLPLSSANAETAPESSTPSVTTVPATEETPTVPVPVPVAAAPTVPAAPTPVASPSPSATPSPTASTTLPTPTASGSPTPSSSTSPSVKPTSPTATATPVPPKVCKLTDVPKAPWRLSAARDATDPTTFTIDWNSVACATRYNVSVFSTGKDDVNIVPGDETTYTVTGTDPSKVYKIQVSSRNDAGQGAATPIYTLYPITPAGITNLKMKYTDVTTATLTWQAPATRQPLAYHVTVTRLADRKTIIEKDISGEETSLPLEGLDSRGMFAITLQAENKYGLGPKARLLVGDERPNPVTAVTVMRDPGDPQNVIVSWLPSDNTLKGAVLGYEVAYGKGRASEHLIVKDTDATVTVPLAFSGIVIVRVLTDHGKSEYSRPVRVLNEGNIGSTTTSTSVDLVEQDGVITVAASQAVADSYRLVVRIAPAASNGGFTDTQYSQAGAQLLSFRKVPQGMYLVTIEGGDKEIARRYVNVGKAGWMFGSDWRLITGKADISNEGVVMPQTGETRVLSTRNMPSQDVTIQSDAQLTAGDGYGFWFRTSGLETGKPSGLTFQYDPKWKGQFIIRLWQNGTECGTPISEVPFPAGLKINGEHRIVMAAQGDTLYATLDGARLVSIPSLSTAIANNKCKYVAPTGTQIGLRKWTSSTVIFKNISIM